MEEKQPPEISLLYWALGLQIQGKGPQMPILMGTITVLQLLSFSYLVSDLSGFSPSKTEVSGSQLVGNRVNKCFEKQEKAHMKLRDFHVRDKEAYQVPRNFWFLWQRVEKSILWAPNWFLACASPGVLMPRKPAEQAGRERSQIGKNAELQCRWPKTWEGRWA